MYLYIEWLRVKLHKKRLAGLFIQYKTVTFKSIHAFLCSFALVTTGLTAVALPPSSTSNTNSFTPNPP